MVTFCVNYVSLLSKGECLMNYIDLFSGAGGLGLGFEWQGFQNLFSVEFNKEIAETYKYNFPKNHLIVDDIKNISDIQLKKIQNNIPVDVIIGGPPCQGFSIAGNIGRKFTEDSRNYLFKEFVRVVNVLKPRIFVMENVARMATHNHGQTIEEICNEFTKIGYSVQYKVLNAANYGVPQNRRRIFVVGTSKGLKFGFPTPSFKVKTVKDAIDDLPKLKSGEKSNIPNHFAMNHSKQMLKKMSYVKEGGGRETIPSNLRPKSGDARKYIRYNRNKPSITITGDMRKVFHYNQNRALSSRELARIQTFPDSFIFQGKNISIQQQIGNAVPPLLAKAIAGSVKQTLTIENKKKYPKVNYIGNKEKISSWIADNIPKGTNSILDLFSGGGSVSYELKKRKYSVISNDSLFSSFAIAKGLIENDNIILDDKALDNALTTPITQQDVEKVMWLADNLYFPEEIKELTKLLKYSKKLTGYQKYIYIALLRRAMIRKLPYSRMNLDWKNIKKLRNEDYSYKKYKRRRAYHNQSFSYHMNAELISYNEAVFSNGKKNFAKQEDAFKLLKKINQVDVIYMDPPYPGTMNNYEGFYGKFDKLFDKQLYFEDLTKSNVFLKKLEELIEIASTKANYALLSINSKTKPSYKDVINMCSFYGKVTLKQKKHNYQVSGKKNKNKNMELLIEVKFYK